MSVVNLSGYLGGGVRDMPIPSKALTTFIHTDNTVCFNNDAHHECYQLVVFLGLLLQFLNPSIHVCTPCQCL